MCIVAILFGLYLVSIVLAPISLKIDQRYFNGPSNRSFTPFVELVLLPVLILLSALSSGTAWYNHPLQVALWGIVAVIFAYGCYVVMAFVVEFVTNVIFSPPKEGKTENQIEDK